jgi:hypothetical protein
VLDASARAAKANFIASVTFVMVFRACLSSADSGAKKKQGANWKNVISAGHFTFSGLQCAALRQVLNVPVWRLQG